MKTTLLFVLGLFVIACGCAGPAPVPVKNGISILSWYNPRITVIASPAAQTNAVESASLRPRDADQQTIQPSQTGLCIILDNLFTFNNGGGTAASNTVPVSFSFNKN